MTSAEWSNSVNLSLHPTAIVYVIIQPSGSRKIGRSAAPTNWFLGVLTRFKHAFLPRLEWWWWFLARGLEWHHHHQNFRRIILYRFISSRWCIWRQLVLSKCNWRHLRPRQSLSTSNKEKTRFEDRRDLHWQTSAFDLCKIPSEINPQRGRLILGYENGRLSTEIASYLGNDMRYTHCYCGFTYRKSPVYR